MHQIRVSSFRRTLTFSCLLISFGILYLLEPNSAHAEAPGKQPPAKTDLLAPTVDKPIHGISWPAISPDGSKVCFTYRGDLWLVPTDGGMANRLTINEALDALPRWSPDGKWISFTSVRSGSADIFLIPSEGGEPRQVTYHTASDWATDWSADGTKLLFYSQRDSRNFGIYSFDLKSHFIKRLTNDSEPLRFPAYSPDGKLIAYDRMGLGGASWFRPWYKGSIAAQIIVQDQATGKAKPLLKSNSQQYWPLFSKDSKSLYITTILGQGNTPNLWLAPVSGGEPKQITKYKTDAVRYPSFARKGSKLSYLWNGDLIICEPDGSSPKKVDIFARTDEKTNRTEKQVLHDGLAESEISPDGKQFALVLRGALWLLPVTGGDAVRLTESDAAYNDITWSPDNSKLALLSDKSGVPEVYTLDIKSKELKKLTNDATEKSNPTWSPDGKWVSFANSGKAAGLYLVPSAGGVVPRFLAEGNGTTTLGIGLSAHAWSPDSRWIAFTKIGANLSRDVWIVPAIGGVPVNVTHDPGSASQVQFSKDGKRLFFISDRDGLPLVQQLTLENLEEADNARQQADRSRDVKIDFNEIQSRIRPAMPPIGAVDDFAVTPDSSRIVVHLQNQFFLIGLNGGQVQNLTNGVPEPATNVRMSPDSPRIFYTGVNGVLRVISGAGGPPASIPFNAEFLLDRQNLYRLAFRQFYREYGAAFYDPDMNGVKWQALRDKYEPYLEGVETSEEFSNVLSEMVGEVNASHSEVTYVPSKVSASQTAMLGIVFDTDYPGPGLKILKTIPKGPADKLHLAPGDFILKFDGKEFIHSEEFYQGLEGKAGKSVEILVNSKPIQDGGRTLAIRPVSSLQLFALESENLVKQSKKTVEKLSDGKLAYIHIPEMTRPAVLQFNRELISDALLKEGLILDVRGNGGGNTHDEILQLLNKLVYGYTQERDGKVESIPPRAFTKPVILLINQNSASDAEIFPAGFRALKLGKIIGTPTPGYVIGTREGTLIDGTSFRMPSRAFFLTDGKNLENLGVTPDILVENTPDQIASGRDHQLEVAIETLLSDIEAHPAKSLPPFSAGNANPNGGSSAVKGGKQ